ncbi:MAG: alanine racemase [Alphaproteobacteria bacterium]
MAFKTSPHCAAGRLSIDLNALKKNYALCKNKVGVQCEVAAAVKANGYGLGAIEVVKALKEEGADLFFVATLDEALELRENFSDQETRIAVLNGLLSDTEELFDFHNLIPVLNSSECIKRWSDYSKRTRPYLKSILHIDTGMRRLGLDTKEAQYWTERAQVLSDTLDIKYVISHFACADEKEHPLTNQQYKDFQNASDSFLSSKKSLANSAGIFRDEKYHFDMVRPGMCLYGLNPTPEQENPMQAVVSLEVPILQIRTALKGESVGYGASYVPQKDEKLATVQLGYADGFLRHLSNAGTLYWHGHACAIVGRVSMDLTIVSLKNIPESIFPCHGDFMEVLGPHQSADRLADDAGTIGYEILTDLGRRYNRSYIR